MGTLRLLGLAAVVGYKLIFTGFNFGAGFTGGTRAHPGASARNPPRILQHGVRGGRFRLATPAT